jgi:hypothetical protein
MALYRGHKIKAPGSSPSTSSSKCYAFSSSLPPHITYLSSSQLAYRSVSCDNHAITFANYRFLGVVDLRQEGLKGYI